MTDAPNPLVKISRNSIRIYFNGILHIDVPLDRYRGLQTWLWGDVGYVEFSITDAPPIQAHYYDREQFKVLMKQLDEKI